MFHQFKKVAILYIFEAKFISMLILYNIYKIFTGTISISFASNLAFYCHLAFLNKTWVGFENLRTLHIPIVVDC